MIIVGVPTVLLIMALIDPFQANGSSGYGRPGRRDFGWGDGDGGHGDGGGDGGD